MSWKTGRATRDFIYVDDIVDGLLRCAAVGRPGDVYNLAVGAETSILDLATAINRMTGNPVPVKIGPARNWNHSGRRLGCTEKASRSLQFEARVALETGLANAPSNGRGRTWTSSTHASASTPLMCRYPEGRRLAIRN